MDNAENTEINEVDRPDFDDSEIEDKTPQTDGVGTSGFPEIKKLMNDVPHKAFDDPAYYKTLMAEGSDAAKRLHAAFQKYVTAKDPKDKTVFRQQITNPYWEFAAGVAKSAPTKLTPAQQFMLRFGVIHPNMLATDSKVFLGKLIVDSDLDQPVYYLDEWLKRVGTGLQIPAGTDEVQVKRGNENSHLRALLDKANGKKEGSVGLLRAKSGDIMSLETQLQQNVESVMQHESFDDIPGVRSCYSESQKATLTSTAELLKALLKSDREMSTYMRDYESAVEDMDSISGKMSAEGDGGGAEGGGTIDLEAVNTEFGSVRQMAKMTVGRQGNPFPILSGEYFRGSPNGVGFKENVIAKLAWIESVDCECFIRYYKNKPTRIVPYTLLLPTYGDLGMCWEPFEKSNKATSRGRIAIPMFPKNLTIAVLYAVGDYRWQAAKEKASFYWMEEGLTGNYYQWYQAQKLKGDLKQYFIQDYIMWMTKESEGTQKLDKEVRGTFWRFMPFAQPIKEKLKDRNMIYQELYQRDKNRAASDL
ncbi:MAG: hypothetical protein Ta2G_06930 [Termitinemataceae bacterium]|nr:MAG: hypothetical protein Ta2G_06930 [Termitinemataceae bacterium]